MSSVAPIPFNTNDTYSLKKSPEYPYFILEAGSQDCVSRGCGPWVSTLLKNYGGWTPSTLQGSDINFASTDLYEGLVQYALSKGGGSLKLLADNVYCFDEEKVNGKCYSLNEDANNMCSLNDYMKLMWKTPNKDFSSPTVFDIDHFMLRAIPPPQNYSSSVKQDGFTGVGMFLPSFTSCSSNKGEEWQERSWPVMPPIGFVNPGPWCQYSQNNSASATTVIFCSKDNRFVQPANLTQPAEYPSVFKSQSFTQQILCNFVTSTGSPVQKEYRLAFQTLGDFFQINKNFAPKSITYYEDGNKALIWAINSQLFRYFLTAPPYQGKVFTPNLSRNLITCDTDANSKKNDWIQANPLYHVTMCVVSNKNTLPYLPLYIPMSLTDLIKCCNGTLNFTLFWWNWADFPISPSIVGLDPSAPLSAAVCFSGSTGTWSYQYEPFGDDCQYIGFAMCNPTSPFWVEFLTDPDATPSCACLNIDNFIARTLGPPPLPAAYGETEAFLRGNIQCIYDQCMKTNALKNPSAPPYAFPCVNYTTCVITDVIINSNSPATIVNNCGGQADTGSGGSAGSKTDPATPGGSFGTTAIILPIAAAAGIVIGLFVMIALKRRRTRAIRNHTTKAKHNQWNAKINSDADSAEEVSSDDSDY